MQSQIIAFFQQTGKESQKYNALYNYHYRIMYLQIRYDFCIHEKKYHIPKKKNQTKKPNQKTKRKFIVLNTFAIENTNYMLRNFKPLINCLNNN